MSSLPHSRRQFRSCPSGKQWYTCAVNGYAGCCSINACDYPDECLKELETTLATITKAKSITSASVKTITLVLTTINTPVTIESMADVLAPTASLVDPTVPETNTGMVVTASAITTPIPSATYTPAPPKTNSLALTLGTTFGILGAFLFLASGWFFFCRRRPTRKAEAEVESTPVDRSVRPRANRWSFSPRSTRVCSGAWGGRMTRVVEEPKSRLAVEGGVGELLNSPVPAELPADGEGKGQLAEPETRAERHGGSRVRLSEISHQRDSLATLDRGVEGGHVLNFMEYHPMR